MHSAGPGRAGGSEPAGAVGGRDRPQRLGQRGGEALGQPELAVVGIEREHEVAGASRARARSAARSRSAAATARASRPRVVQVDGQAQRVERGTPGAPASSGPSTRTPGQPGQLRARRPATARRVAADGAARGGQRARRRRRPGAHRRTARSIAAAGQPALGVAALVQQRRRAEPREHERGAGRDRVRRAAPGGTAGAPPHVSSTTSAAPWPWATAASSAMSGIGAVEGGRRRRSRRGRRARRSARRRAPRA